MNPIGIPHRDSYAPSPGSDLDVALPKHAEQRENGNDEDDGEADSCNFVSRIARGISGGCGRSGPTVHVHAVRRCCIAML